MPSILGQSAGQKTLAQSSGMPQINAAFSGWMNTISLVKITQVVGTGDDAGLVEDVEQIITFQGVIQPLKPSLIQLKPEGQRSFEWLQIHCFSGSLNLVPNDRIIWNDKKFKVMGQNDYSLDNFIEYHIIKDYE